MALITPFWGLDGVVVLFGGFICVYLYFTRNFKYWKKLGVKEVPPTSFLGNFSPTIFARKPLIVILQEIYDAGREERYIGYHVIDKPHLMIRDTELIKHVLIKDFNFFQNRNASSSDIVGSKNLFVVNNPDWKYIRQKLSPIFTTGRLKKMFELMLEIGKDLDAYMESLNLEGKINLISTH